MNTSDLQPSNSRHFLHMATMDQGRAAWRRFLRALLLGVFVLCGAIFVLFMLIEAGDWMPGWLALLLGLGAFAVIPQGGFLYPLFEPVMQLGRTYLEPFPRLRSDFVWLATAALAGLLFITVYAVFATDWLIR